MANQEQLDILKQGVAVWNTWRAENPRVHIDLGGANLKDADLKDADLTDADLSHADLRGANLLGATLIGADLGYANLSGAKLNSAKLISTYLIGTDLRDAILIDAYFNDANLRNANFSDAELWSVFADVDLSVAEGLEAVNHLGPSTIGIDTIYRSQGKIPEAFLKGAGIDDTFISYTRSLVGKPIERYSCFISYSSKDEAFAKRLYADLQNANVRCWFAPEDLKWGARTRPSIDEAIRLHDKLLLILSKNSVASGWVEHEVKTALAREHKERRTMLFPVRVDRAVFDSPLEWATEIRHERNIGDFTHWKNYDEYEKSLSRLLRDLKAAP